LARRHYPGRVSETVAVQLSDDERALLVRGLGEWGGPTRPTDALARAMGSDDVAGLLADTKRVAVQLEAGEPLTAADWARSLIATEIAFASDYYGSGWDWSTTVGLDDEETIRRLRQLQRKLISVARLP
jgi:hypothetical protein